MDGSDDIEFLRHFRAAIVEYLGPSGAPSITARYGALQERRQRLGDREGELRQRIAEGKGRAHRLLTECGCHNMVAGRTSYPAVGVEDTKTYRLFDLVLDNPSGQRRRISYFTDPIDEAIGVLKAPAAARQQAQPVSDHTAPQSDALAAPIQRLERLARRFPHVATQLGQRRGGRDAYRIDDEYDVQDLFHALLWVDFDDIRPEEPLPSHAGSSSRMDFLLADHGIVVEIKMTRPGLDRRKVKEELLVDIPQYCQHPDCRALVAFVYDLLKRISNPTGLEKDLSTPYNGMPVHVFVVQG